MKSQIYLRFLGAVAPIFLVENESFSPLDVVHPIKFAGVPCKRIIFVLATAVIIDSKSSFLPRARSSWHKAWKYSEPACVFRQETASVMVKI